MNCIQETNSDYNNVQTKCQFIIRNVCAMSSFLCVESYCGTTAALMLTSRLTTNNHGSCVDGHYFLVRNAAHRVATAGWKYPLAFGNTK
jgi:hypothetical protein